MKILELPQPSLGLDKSFCFGDSVLLDGGSFESYNWNTSDTLQSLFVSLPGQYVLQVSNALGCYNSDTILINQTLLAQTELNISDNEIIVVNPGEGWEMLIKWIPFGYRQSYNFTIRVKASVLQDLKWERKKDWYDY